MVASEERTKGAAIDVAERALAEAEKQFGKSGKELAPFLTDLGDLFNLDGYYAKAELMYKRHLDIVQQGDGAQVDKPLCRLAAMYRIEQKFDDAEALYLKLQALAQEEKLDEAHMAQRLNFLAGLYYQKGEVAQALELVTRALSFYQKVPAQGAFQIGLTLTALAVLHLRLGREGDAVEMRKKAKESLAASDSGEPGGDRQLVKLIDLYLEQNRLNEAALAVTNSVFFDVESLWPNHPLVGDAYFEKAELFRAQAFFDDADVLFKRSMQVRETSLGVNHPEVAVTAMALASMYMAQGRFADAEPVIKKAMKARVVAFGAEHPSVAACIECYAALLKKTKRQALANKMETRAREIRAKLVSLAERAAAQPPSP
jgi:tetratricopeptide (TPR) repeat protein